MPIPMKTPLKFAISLAALLLLGLNAVHAQQLAPILTPEEEQAIEKQYPGTSNIMPQPSVTRSNNNNYNVIQNPDGKITLQSSVKNLSDAIRDEQGRVDWYGWYMNARNIIANNGGIQCALGTPIRFHRNGQVKAVSYDPRCQISVSTLSVPLPRETSIDVIILPTRRGSAPPNSPEELYEFLRQSENPASYY